jgi:predicted lipoprotein with Yx(FWY)xxD motif
MPVALAAGLATAALVGVAIAKTFTLNIAKNATVMNFNTRAVTHENILVALSRGHAVYTLTGDSKSHPECIRSNGCFGFWPPLTVSSPSKLTKAPGIPGKLGIWKRDGFDQVTLNGHPLYFFSQDKMAHDATGQDIHSFHGTWFVVKEGGATTTMSTPTVAQPPPTTPTTPTTPPPPPCVPYPGYPCP